MGRKGRGIGGKTTDFPPINVIVRESGYVTVKMS